MVRFLKALVLLPVAVIVVLLSVANRESVTLSLDPFSAAPDLSFSLPLFAVIFASLMLGVLIGGVAAWIAQGKHRRAHRQYGREVRHLRQETDRLRAQSPAPSASSLPALPSQGSAF